MHFGAQKTYDQPTSLLKLLTWDWDDISVLMALEAVVGIQIEGELPRFLMSRFFWWREPGSPTIGEWCLQVAEHLESRCSNTYVGQQDQCNEP